MTREEIYQKRKAEGRCVDCGAPAAPGRVRCKTHLKIGRKSSKKYYKDGSNQEKKKEQARDYKRQIKQSQDSLHYAQQVEAVYYVINTTKPTKETAEFIVDLILDKN